MTRETREVYNRRWRTVRLAVLVRDGWACQIKGPKCRGRATTADHIVPWRSGGALHDPDNLRAACVSCNSGHQQPAIAPFGRARQSSSPCRWYPHDGCRGVDEVCPRCGQRGPSRVWTS